MPASSKHNLDVLVEEAAYIMMYSMRGVIRQPTIRSCVCVCVCVCVFVCAEKLTSVYMYSTANIPRLLSRSNFMKTHKSISVLVSTLQSQISSSEREDTLEVEKGGHYHVTFQKIGGGKNLTVYLICST